MMIQSLGLVILLVRSARGLAPCTISLPAQSTIWNQNSSPHLTFPNANGSWEDVVELQSGDLLTVTFKGWELDWLTSETPEPNSTSEQYDSSTVTEASAAGESSTTDRQARSDRAMAAATAGSSDATRPGTTRSMGSDVPVTDRHAVPSEDVTKTARPVTSEIYTTSSDRPTESTQATDPPQITLPQAYLTSRSQGCDLTDAILLDVQIATIVPHTTMILSDKDMGDGENHLIIVTGKADECARIKVTVKSDNCGEGIDCSNQGACYTNATMEGFECQCCPGYIGPHCEEKDACFPSPCLNDGICVDISQGHQGSSFQCLCPYGFRGKVCEDSGDPCESMPCQHGGTCSQTNETAAQFKCACLEGFAGTVCQQQVDPCASSPCQHGICVSQNRSDSYNCFCKPGYTGTLCEMEYNECESSPCHHGGTCQDKVNGYTCSCTAGYTGPTCQTKIDLCGPEPCGRHRRCLDRGDSFICQCPSGFTGPDCLIPTRAVCLGNPCRNGGTCWTSLDSYYCACRPGFTGNSCQDELVVEVVGGEGLEEAPPPPPSAALHLHSITVAASTLLAAMLFVVLTVVVCHCRTHETYKRCCFEKSSASLFPTTLSGSFDNKLKKNILENGRKPGCILDHCDVFCALDLSDSQSSPLIQ